MVELGDKIKSDRIEQSVVDNIKRIIEKKKSKEEEI